MRVSNWTSIFDASVNAARSKKFAWGSHDCCTFAAYIALAITGRDLLADYRGTYSTEAEADVITSAGGGLVAMVSTRAVEFSWPRVSVLMARRGDVVAYKHAVTDKIGLGICCGSSAAIPCADGLGFVPLNKCLCAWRVD